MPATLVKINDRSYKLDNHFIHKSDPLWTHTVMRVEEARKKAKTTQEFYNKMVTRLKRIKQKEKLYYAIAVLYEKGEEDLADMYDAKVVMDILADL